MSKCSPPNPIPLTWPRNWCPDGRAMPLIQGHNMTCTTGECTACGALFGQTMKIEVPHITYMAREIASSGQAPSVQSTIPVYPDVDGSTRYGRDEDVPGEDDVWKLVEGGKGPPTTTSTTTTTTTTVKRSNPRRRRRRTGAARRRRRRSSKSRRRSSRRRRKAKSALLEKEVGMHQ